MFFCVDFSSEFSDLSFGDAWSKKKKLEDDQGSNIVVVRNSFADKLLKEADDYLCLERIDQKIVLESYGLRLKLKKQCFKMKSAVGKLFGIFIPNYNIKYKPAGFFYRFLALLFLLFGIISNKFHMIIIGLPAFLWRIPLEIHKKGKKFLK